jgi:hypothetical protein
MPLLSPLSFFIIVVARFSLIEVDSKFLVFQLPLNMLIKITFHFSTSLNCFILCRDYKSNIIDKIKF